MKRIPSKLQPWFDARQRYQLTHAQIQMARELGMNPKSFGKLDNHHQECWKLPLAEFIAECYKKRFGLATPKEVRSLEDLIKADEARCNRKRLLKASKANAE